MGKAAPTPSNYTGAAQAQANASQGNVNAQTAANRPNINGTTSSQQWTQDANGNWTLTQGYGGASGIASQLQGQAGDALNQPLDNGSAARQQTIDSAYSQATSRLDPQWAQRQQIADSTLANQGIDPNSAAAQAARREFSQQRNDAYGGAMANAVREGNAAGGEVFRNNLAARNNPLQQLLALAGMQGPQFNAAGVAQSPDLLAASMGQDAANLRSWSAQQQATADAIGAGMQGLGSIAKLFAF